MVIGHDRWDRFSVPSLGGINVALTSRRVYLYEAPVSQRRESASEPELDHWLDALVSMLLLRFR